MGYSKAEEILKDKYEIERLLQRIEKKEKIPVIGGKLSSISVLVSLHKSYIDVQLKIFQLVQL